METKGVVAWATTAAAALFFVYTALAGALMASASLSVTLQREKAAKADQGDVVGVTVKIERNENFSIRLLGGEVRAVRCEAGGKDLLAGKDPPRAELDMVPMFLTEAGPDRPVGSDDWVRRRIEDVYYPFKDNRYSMAPKETTSFSALIQVPPKSICLIEANVAYQQWVWLPSLSRGSLMASAISMPTASAPAAPATPAEPRKD